MKKAERLLIIVILCLCGYLIYDIYQPQVGCFLKKIQSGGRFLLEEETSEETGKEEKKAADQEEELPAFYDGREQGRAAEIKNQGQLGTCWAVAASSALESGLLPEEREVFSADHISMQNGYNKNQEDGGAYTMAMAYLASWKGPVREADDPYGDGESPDDLEAVRHVQEMQMLREKDYTGMKELIRTYGSVQSSLYMDMQDGRYTSTYYNEAWDSYCYPGGEEANHDVLVIGWDDHYPASNFNAQVKKDGAFICQNSWGTSFGEQGIFYVSYEDALIGENCIAYTGIEPVDNYDRLYQADQCGWVGQLGYDSDICWFASVYETGEAPEQIEAVGFYATGQNTEYEIFGVEEFSGKWMLTGADSIQSGSFEKAGYYTVEFEEPFSVREKQKFAVIVKIRTPDENYPVAAEYRADEYTKNADISDGEGYISPNGYNWTNTESEYECNLCLKVYTSQNPDISGE